MPPNVDANYRCATLWYLVDARRDVSVPVGVALWSRERNWLRFRFPRNHERIEGVSIPTATSYLDQVRTQIEGWMRRGELPYAKEPIVPLSDAWWDQVRRLLQFSVRLGHVQPVDCHNPEEEIESLFEALIQPRDSPRANTTRIGSDVIGS